MKQSWRPGTLSLFLFGLLLINSCGSTQFFSKKDQKTIADQINSSAVFSKIFTGFALYDPQEKKILFEQEANKYYTPASNTKLFTFYAALNVLQDQLPVLNFGFSGDSLIFWGTGNPLLLHPDFDQWHQGLELLKSGNGKLYYSDYNFKDKRFGAGWAWDDYSYYYQPEKSALPLFGNVVRFIKNDSTPLSMNPPLFKKSLRDTFPTESFYLGRQEQKDWFLIDSTRLGKQNLERDIPFRQSREMVIKLLSDTLKKEVGYYEGKPQVVQGTLSIPFPDTLYRRLLQDSDNFIAEQLMLMVSDRLFGELNTSKAIQYVKDSLLSSLPHPPAWRDGSGLSRYNQMTPLSIIRLLELIYEKVPQERLFSLLPAGGKSGTIKSWYSGDPPYVFAKTGTLSGKHCLSGYLKTKSGRILIFSFMNNNYISGSTPIKEEMQKVLEWIRDNI